MSNLGLQMSPESDVPEGPRHRGRSWAAVLLSLVVIGVIALGVKALIDRVPLFGAGPADYVGEGTDPVQVRVDKGQTLAQIGQTLKEADVVSSVDAWIAATKKEPRSATIGPALYNMRLQMSADAALTRMLDPSAKVVNELLLREGLRIWETYDAITEVTDIKQSTLKKAAEGGKIGLPGYAKDDPEGFMFPATYQLDPNESATSILRRLTTRWDQAAEQVGLTAGAKRMGVSEYQAVIIASLVQAEGHPTDYDKVARVIYNRLDPDIWGDTNGLLQMDAALNYALKNKDVVLTSEQIQKLDSPYNLYKHQGLPPTPINSPGEEALKAAVQPAEGDWLYYVTVNTDTGETKFTNDYDQFLKYKKELSDFLDKKGR
jgi:peptidoglycan lytic transglycosylase G